MKQFHFVAAAGTFDHIHKGHRAFLSKAFEVGERVLIGVTSDEMVRGKHFAGAILPYDDRIRELTAFLEERFSARYTIVQISDIYGPAVTDTSLEAIVVTQDTKKNALELNRKRTEKGLLELSIVEVEFVQDIEGEPIASTQIRRGVSDREGNVYDSQKLGLHPRTMTELHRPSLQTPLGKLYEADGKVPALIAGQALKKVGTSRMVITVGDVTTKSVLESGYTPAVSIIDLHVRRKKIHEDLTLFGYKQEIHHIHTSNPRSTVSSELFSTVAKALALYEDTHMPVVLQVKGEEDLAVLPVVLLAPLGSIVFYGQPPLPGETPDGLVVVEVTEETKAKVNTILSTLQSA